MNAAEAEQIYWLISNLVDPEKAPAVELAVHVGDIDPDRCSFPHSVGHKLPAFGAITIGAAENLS